MMAEAIVTRSAAGAAATTLPGEAQYVPSDSARTVVVGSLPVGAPVSDEETQELRRRLREGR